MTLNEHIKNEYLLFWSIVIYSMQVCRSLLLNNSSFNDCITIWQALHYYLAIITHKHDALITDFCKTSNRYVNASMNLQKQARCAAYDIGFHTQALFPLTNCCQHVTI